MDEAKSALHEFQIRVPPPILVSLLGSIGRGGGGIGEEGGGRAEVVLQLIGSGIKRVGVGDVFRSDGRHMERGGRCSFCRLRPCHRRECLGLKSQGTGEANRLEGNESHVEFSFFG